MSDIVVTVPLSFGLDRWVGEGDPAGEPWSGEYWGFTVGGSRPPISPGERVYIVCAGRLRGYAPLVSLHRGSPYGWALVRGGGAVAVTIEERIRGFRGWVRRWWDRAAEVPFPDWQGREHRPARVEER